MSVSLATRPQILRQRRAQLNQMPACMPVQPKRGCYRSPVSSLKNNGPRRYQTRYHHSVSPTTYNACIVMQTSRASSSSELELRARAGSNVHIFLLEQLEHKRFGLELSSTSLELSRKNEVPPVAAAPSSTAQLRGPRHPYPQLPPDR
jgi:hypothetical protein